MIISTEPPFLFVHIPKTAGTSVEEALFHYQAFEYHTSPHNITQQYKDFLPRELFDSMFKFCFVRNPWDLMVSSYKYWVRNNHIKMTFEEWILWRYDGGVIGDMIDRIDDDPNTDTQLQYSEKFSRLTVAFYMNRTPQSLFFLDESGNYLVDFIGRFESIQEDFDFIVNTLKLQDAYLPHTNTTFNPDDPKDYKSWYTDKTKKIVGDRFSLDIELFGYTFEGGIPHPGKCGLVKKEHNSITKNGYKMPSNYFINLGGIPYGLNDIVYRHNINEEDLNNRKLTFKNDQIRSRINSLHHNINTIENNINSLEELMYNCDDESEVSAYQIQIIKLREAELVFKHKLKKFKRDSNIEY